MNKKGFISITVIYSFFLVFLTLMMFIIVNMVSNRNLLNGVKKAIKEDIANQITLENVCSSGTNLATCIKTFANEGSSVSKIYYHNGTLENGINDGSYRYAGASSEVNNYVCFGSTESSCPVDNLYRIIGVFDGQVKLIKSTIASSTLLGTDGDYVNETNYYWNYKNNTTTNSGNGSNTWSTSLLNVKNLNTNYINNIGSTWSNKIAKVTWKVGGNTFANIGMSIPSTAYAWEITSPVTNNTTDNASTYQAKIGLMYVTDYGYAASSSAWTTTHYDYDSSLITGVNWLYIGVDEWTITRYSEGSYNVFGIDSAGYVSGNFANRTYGVRPCFYLNAEVSYVKGKGSTSSPIRIN